MGAKSKQRDRYAAEYQAITILFRNFTISNEGDI
jgi:hypothetical protein